MFKGKITKNPSKFNIDTATGKIMYERYSNCPFDTLHKGYYETLLIRSDTWRGRLHPLQFWKPVSLLRKDHWKCLTCGAEWDSEVYPIDLNKTIGV